MIGGGLYSRQGVYACSGVPCMATHLQAGLAATQELSDDNSSCSTTPTALLAQPPNRS